MREKETMVVAKIAEYHVMVILMPYQSKTLEPIGPRGPIVFRRKKPTTVGGRTMGRVRMQSRTPLTILWVFAM